MKKDDSRRNLIIGAVVAVVVIAVLVALGQRNAADLDAAGNPTLGDGELQVFLFEDYQCPHCRDYTLGPAYQHLMETWVDPGHVTVVFKHVAFVGPSSDDAGRASQCVFAQAGAEWEEWDHLVYQQQLSSWEPHESNLYGLTKAWGKVDLQDYTDCLDHEQALDEVLERNQDDMGAAGVASTPSLVVGTAVLNPSDTAAVDAAIQEALGAQQ